MPQTASELDIANVRPRQLRA